MDKMSDTDSPDHREMSLHLARALDNIGLNMLTVKRRRHAFLCEEQIHRVSDRLNSITMTEYHFGSQTEGTTTPGLHSDIDTLACINNANVIEDIGDFTPGKCNLLMVQEDTAPGYCRLQLLDGLQQEELPNDEQKLVFKEIGNRVFLKNTANFIVNDELDYRTGPAISRRRGRLGHERSDTVYALPCSIWPRQTEEFIRRRRRHDWPSQQLLEEATSHGVFLVPVGHKLSQPADELLEWRISASLAERYLMFSLNIVHIKCYVVLKLLVKSFIEPRIEKCISSYHCKTTLLYCIENTEAGFWREDNLLVCVIRCLEMLRNWVVDLFCPHFIIKDENLFAGKVTVDNRDLLLSILTEMIESDGRVLLRVTIDDLGQILHTNMTTEPSREPLTDSLASVKVTGWFESDRQRKLNLKSLLLTLSLYNGGDHIPVVRVMHRDITKLQRMLEGSNNKHERQAIKSYITFLSCWLGSLLASYSLARNKKVPREAIQLICTAAKYDISSMLKLTTIYYHIGNYRKAETLLRAVEYNVCRYDLSQTCGCFFQNHDVQLESCYMMHAHSGTKSQSRLFANCVRFSRHEINYVPPELCYELNRAIDDDIEQRIANFDDWMDLAVVDCLPYMYYLQYLNYRQLGKHDLQKRSLLNLERSFLKDCRHIDTFWNLLGQCWASEQKPNLAIACYAISQEYRRRNNAANRHLQDAGLNPYTAFVWWYMSLVGRMLGRMPILPFLDVVATRIPLGTEPLLLIPLLPMIEKITVSTREFVYFLLHGKTKARNLSKGNFWISQYDPYFETQSTKVEYLLAKTMAFVYSFPIYLPR